MILIYQKLPMIWNFDAKALEEDNWLIKLAIESKKSKSIDYGKLL
jgi:hypothetical protein